MIHIAVLASGEGTNLQALIDAVQSRRIHGQIVLVVSSKDNAPALSRAQRAGIETLTALPKDFSSPEAYDAFLASECRKRSVDLVCLAGFMLKLKDPMLTAFSNQILNIHPALLPAFGGQGMYGLRVHEAVLRSGAKVTGCTVHFVDAIYDHGSIVLQATVPVLPNDTSQTLAARVRAQEHWLYPEAVKLFAENRLALGGEGVKILGSHEDSSSRVKRALLSAADKTGLIEFAKGLEELGVEIISTSGTAEALRGAGICVRPLDSLTGFPEILDGRVKTLHPRIHGGILLRRKDPAQVREAALFGLEPIDLVVVNLYPFERVLSRAHSPHSREVIENIDIGGVTLIRAAAKNFEDVAVVVSPKDYPLVLRELENSGGQISPELRQRLALTAFEHTADYDAKISRAWSSAQALPVGPRSEFGRAAQAGSLESSGTGPTASEAAGEEKFPQELILSLQKIQDLRYGENPHQSAALYAPKTQHPCFEQLHGKELSYNNLLDAFGAWEAASEFQNPAAAIFKHVTPSGIGIGPTLVEALEKAWACDPQSAFGGVLAVNIPCPTALAQALNQRFLEVIAAPAFEPGALELLKTKRNLRLLIMKSPPGATVLFRSLGEEVLATEPDRQAFGDALRTVTRRPPTPEEEEALRFAWVAAKHVKSNAIVLASSQATVGIGAGQMSRVDSVKMAGLKYQEYLKAQGTPNTLVLASDAFFPFRDGIDEAAKIGITAIIQPGGSLRDEEVIAAANEHKLAMLFTGMRHFRH